MKRALGASIAAALLLACNVLSPAAPPAPTAAPERVGPFLIERHDGILWIYGPFATSSREEDMALLAHIRGGDARVCFVLVDDQDVFEWEGFYVEKGWVFGCVQPKNGARS